VFKPGEEWQPAETWSQWMRRIVPVKVVADAERRLDREQLLWRWPAVVRVKSEYDRRRHARARRSR
jgi:hypothetical protein